MKLFLAPLQGFTTAEFRNLHEKYFGAIDAYFTPFVRLEKDALRKRDVRDIESSTVSRLIPQVLASNADELEKIIELLRPLELKEIDLNCGCPFPPVCNKGRGAGILAHPDKFAEMTESLSRYNGISFSMKLRLGLNSADEIKELVPVINSSALSFVTLHPRIAKDQYKGALRMDDFANFISECQKPVVFNGEIRTKQDYDKTVSDFPDLHGIMIGRGLLANPDLANEIKGESDGISKEKFLGFHNELQESLSSRLEGEQQTLSHLLPYWEYLLPDISAKARKAIMKSRNLSDYKRNVRMAMG
ncbi:MAG: tRNA-dihydrouridine synthase family protein [Paludibacteraceae bacterium]|nr:tRNA-dihydrouridine synthase family protein [Paludibacteraceae bacterium]